MDAPARLAAWLTAGGADLSAVTARTVDGLRGLHTTRPLSAGEPAVRIPRAFVVTHEDVAATVHLSLSSRQALHAVWLLSHDLDPCSSWRPYLDTLPRTVDIPLDADPALLAGTLAGRYLDELRTELVLDHLALSLSVTRAAFTWARVTTDARLFAVADTIALVPYADLCNHALDPTAYWAFSDDFTLVARQDLPADTPLTLSYGAKSNSRLLAQYGFCLPDNPHDEAELAVPMPFTITRDPTTPAARALFSWLHTLSLPPGPTLRASLHTALSLLPDLSPPPPHAPTTAALLLARRSERAVLLSWLTHAATL